MKLTKQHLKALAREARKLAFEIVEGSPPRFSPYSWCGCAAGEVTARLGVVERNSDEHHALSAHVEREYGQGCLLSLATFDEVALHEGALVFPLLHFADNMDEAAVTSGASAAESGPINPFSPEVSK